MYAGTRQPGAGLFMIVKAAGPHDAGVNCWLAPFEVCNVVLEYMDNDRPPEAYIETSTGGYKCGGSGWCYETRR